MATYYTHIWRSYYQYYASNKSAVYIYSYAGGHSLSLDIGHIWRRYIVSCFLHCRWSCPVYTYIQTTVVLRLFFKTIPDFPVSRPEESCSVYSSMVGGDLIISLLLALHYPKRLLLCPLPGKCAVYTTREHIQHLYCRLSCSVLKISWQAVLSYLR